MASKTEFFFFLLGENYTRENCITLTGSDLHNKDEKRGRARSYYSVAEKGGDERSETSAGMGANTAGPLVSLPPLCSRLNYY